MLVGLRQGNEAVNFVTHVAEAARLVAIAVNRERFAAQSLLHEIGDDASVIELHARAVGIKDANDARVHFVITVVGHGYRFGETLGLVVNRARPDRVHIPPIGFLLRMLQGISVTLRRGRDEILRAVFMSDVEGVKGANGADLERGNPMNCVIDRAGGAGEVEHVIDVADVEWLANVLFYKFERGLIAEMIEIDAASGEEIIDDNHAAAFW